MKLSEILEKTIEWWSQDKYACANYAQDRNHDEVMLTSGRAECFCVLGAIAKTIVEKGMDRGVPLDEFSEDYAFELIDHYGYFHTIVPLVDQYIELNTLTVQGGFYQHQPALKLAQINDELGYDEAIEALFFIYKQCKFRDL